MRLMNRHGIKDRNKSRSKRRYNKKLQQEIVKQLQKRSQNNYNLIIPKKKLQSHRVNYVRKINHNRKTKK